MERRLKGAQIRFHAATLYSWMCDVVVLRRPYCLRDLLERGLQDHTNRGFARHFAGLIGDYAPVGRE